MSKAAGARKPSESQRAKALWAMKATKDREEDFNDPAGKDDILGRNQIRQELWKEHLKDLIEALDKVLKYSENLLTLYMLRPLVDFLWTISGLLAVCV